VDRGDAWIDESTPVAPSSYNRTTLDAEQSAEWFSAHGGTGVVLRFAAMYGPDALMREVLDVMRKGWSPLPGDPSAYLSSLAHRDAGSAVVAALGVPAGTYNVAEDEPVRRGEWVRTLAAAARLRAPRFLPTSLTALGGSTMRLLARAQRMSNKRFRGASGWEPHYRTAPDAWADVVGALEAEARGDFTNS
jgi:nucleoside-diphosphate-sugar epimerase